MAGSVNPFPRSRHKFAATQRLTCRNAIFVGVAFIVFEVGFMSSQVGSRHMAAAVTSLLYRNMNISEFDSVDLVSVDHVSVDHPTVSALNIDTGVKKLDNKRERDHVSVGHPAVSALNIDTGEKELDSELPLSLRPLSSLTRDSPDADFHREHEFSQPLVIQTYMRHKAGSKHALEVVIITTGVTMGTFERNFTGAGCMIGDHVYPVDNFFEDRALCTVPRGIEKGAPITLVIYNDDVVETALSGPVTIAKEFVAELEEGDLKPLKRGTKLHGRLAKLDVRDLLAVRSRVVYEEQLDPYSSDEYSELPRYEICLGTQIKPSTHLLPDWLDYHRRLGVDFVYVFDNHAEEDVSELLADRHDVEVMYWPWEKTQIQAFTYAVYAMRARCEWLLLMDSDEYIMLGLDGDDDLSKRGLPPFKRYVRNKEQEGFGHIAFHWVIMKNSGYVSRPDKPVPEAYVHREDPQVMPDQEVTLGKTMASMDLEWVSANAHTKRVWGKTKRFDTWILEFYPRRITDTGMIVHYRKRSWEEYREKMKSGRANINNPKSMTLLRIWDEKGRPEYKEKYMRFSLLQRKVYTHFRNIWRRVTSEIKVGESVTRRVVDGRRCRRFYNLSRDEFAKPLRETCTSETKRRERWRE